MARKIGQDYRGKKGVPLFRVDEASAFGLLGECCLQVGCVDLGALKGLKREFLVSAHRASERLAGRHSCGRWRTIFAILTVRY